MSMSSTRKTTSFQSENTNKKGKGLKNKSGKKQKGQDYDDELPILLPALREMLKDDKHVVRRDDEFLTPFLRVRTYDVKRAAISVKNFYANVERNADLLQDIRASQFVAYYNTHLTAVLDGRAKDGSSVGYAHFRAWDVSAFPAPQVDRAIIVQLFTLFLAHKETQLKGFSVILNFDGLTLTHVAQVKLRQIKLALVCAQGGAPVRIPSIHLINYPSIFWGLYYVTRPFVKEKLMKRVYFHKNLETLYEHFDQEKLPKSLGGPLEMEDAIHKPWYEKMFRENKYANEYYL